MKLVVISHKECWADPNSPTGYSTIGGFPFQMRSISELFDQTIIIQMLKSSEIPKGVRPIDGHNLKVIALKEPSGENYIRKINFILWFIYYFPRIWNEIRAADAVHTPVPGDFGIMGIILGLLQHKPLFVRHCGTWGVPSTIIDKILMIFLEKIARGRVVVLATGGGFSPPSSKNPNIKWIFSTTLTENDFTHITQKIKDRPDDKIYLIYSGRLDHKKNVESIIKAFKLVREHYSNVFLNILGTGREEGRLRSLTHNLSLSDFVNFTGSISHQEVLNNLLRAHIFVFPTNVKEGFPKALLEALACGLPVIATNISVIPYLVTNEVGILIEKTDPETVANAIMDLINRRDQWAIMSQKAIALARNYTLEKWKEEIKIFLEHNWKTNLSDYSIL